MKIKQLGVLGLVLASMLGVVGCGETKEETKDKSTVEVVKEQEKKQEEEKKDDEKKLDEVVVLDKDGVKVTFTGKMKKDYSGGAELTFIVENNRDAKMMFSTDNTSFNGNMGYGGLTQSVMPGKKSVVEYNIWNDDLEKAGMTYEDLTDIEFSLWIYDYDDYQAFDLKSDVFKINLK